MSRILWSLELASGFFHDFFAYDFGGEEQRLPESQAWNWPLFCKGERWRKRWRIPTRSQSESPKGTQLRGMRFTRNLVTENARSEVKEFVTGMWIEIVFLLSLFFLLGQPPPLVLDRKSSNLLSQTPNPTFSIPELLSKSEARKSQLRLP